MPTPRHARTRAAARTNTLKLSTAGPTSSADIQAGLAALQAPSGSHMTVHTFGFGEGHSVELLQAIAAAQSGVYYFIAKEEDIANGFGDGE